MVFPALAGSLWTTYSPFEVLLNSLLLGKFPVTETLSQFAHEGKMDPNSGFWVLKQYKCLCMLFVPHFGGF